VTLDDIRARLAACDAANAKLEALYLLPHSPETTAAYESSSKLHVALEDDSIAIIRALLEHIDRPPEFRSAAAAWSDHAAALRCKP
jgi:hypothetical protein